MRASGIRPAFAGLSQTSGQVSHVLLTRSPLGLPQCCHWLDLVRLACVKHAASVRPEPGSNSPSRSTVCASEEAQPGDRRASSEPGHVPDSKPAGTEIRRCTRHRRGIDGAYDLHDHVGRNSRGDRPHSLFRPLFCFQGANDFWHALWSERWCRRTSLPLCPAEPCPRGGLTI
jgi:hypothetical protein